MGHFDGFRITSGYGNRIHPISRVKKFHTGIDMVKTHKASIYPFVPGIVVWAKWGSSGTGYGGYGNVVVVQDKNKHNHLYAHLDEIKVKEGQAVTKQTVIGLQGNTGQSAGSHLHYEVRKGGYGTHIDPVTYLDSYVKKEKEEEAMEKGKVMLDGKLVGECIILEGRSYLPVRALENKRYVVESYDGATKTVYLKSVK